MNTDSGIDYIQILPVLHVLLVWGLYSSIKFYHLCGFYE